MENDLLGRVSRLDRERLPVIPLTAREGRGRLWKIEAMRRNSLGRKKQTEAQTALDRQAKGKPLSGTQEKVLADLERYVKNPDKPMVPVAIANKLAATRNMGISPSKMFEDKGHKVDVIRYLAARGYSAVFPSTADGLIAELDEYLQFMTENMVPPTIGGFAIWCGVTLVRYEQIARDQNASSGEVAKAARFARECIRQFLEIAALEGTVNALIFFHSQKVYYGYTEQVNVNINTENNVSDISDDEYLNRRKMLTLDSDGVYR